MTELVEENIKDIVENTDEHNGKITTSIEDTKNISNNIVKHNGKSMKIDKSVVPRGKPKSGRIWKTEKKKFSSIVKTKGIRDKFEKKEALRTELKRVKEASRSIIAAKNEEIERKKQRRRDNIKRQEENRIKSEIVQVIRNPSKIKRMRKKQLRNIEKRDTTNM